MDYKSEKQLRRTFMWENTTYIVMGVLVSITNNGTNKGHKQEWSTQGSQMQSVLTFPSLLFV
jgi:hypothetical protein